MNPHERILRAAQSTAWAILPAKLDEIMGFLQLRAQGLHADADTREAFKAVHEANAARAQSVTSSAGGAVAVIPVYGTIMQRASMMSYYSGGSSTEDIGAQFRSALNDSKVRAIVLDIDSPGGSVSGVQELFDLIYSARGKKDVIAISDTLMASAAYYIAAAAKEIWASPSSLTGSVGVYCTHEDDSGYLEKAGIKITQIQYGENKTNGNPYQPLDDKSRAEMQAMVDTFGAAFDAACAKGRDITAAQVRARFGQGKVFGAKEAKSIGMVDKIGTLDDVLSKYGVSRFSGGSGMSMSRDREHEAIGSAEAEPVIAAAAEPKAEDTADCPRGEDCPAQQDDITDSADCPAEDCPLKGDDDTDAKAKCAAAHAHRCRLIQLAAA